jgi:hypothetical protein
MYGLRSVSDILEEGDTDDEVEAVEIWKEERESWLVYEARKSKQNTLKHEK